MVYTKKKNTLSFCKYLKQRLGYTQSKVECDNHELISRLIAQITLNEYIETEIQKMIKIYKKQFLKHHDFKDFLKKKTRCKDQNILEYFVIQKKGQFKYNKEKSEKKLYREFKLNKKKKNIF